MSDPTWVSFGSLAASSFSALAAYLAIRQTIKQRRISNKVQLITKNQKFIIYHGGFDAPIPLSKPTEQFDITIPIINAGLGPAIKLEYEWDFNYEKAFSEINVLKQKQKQNDTIADYSNRINNKEYLYTISNFKDDQMVTVYGFGDTHPYIQKYINNDENYILPYSTGKNENQIPFPNIILMLLIQSILKKSNDFDSLFQPISGASLIIRYEDVSGVKEEVIFKTIIKLEKIFMGGSKSLQELTFSMSYSHPYTWTALVREKIRERYVAFKRRILLNGNR